MNTTEWRPVPGWEGLYEVSDDGQVRAPGKMDSRGRWRKPRVLAGSRQSEGYLGVILCRNGKPYNRRVHQLVAEAFLGPRPDGQLVRHLNSDPTDNRLCNLAYGTNSENAQDRALCDATRRRAKAISDAYWSAISASR